VTAPIERAKRLGDWWTGRRPILLALLLLLLALLTVQRLEDGFSRLLWAPAEAIDLKIRRAETRNWFAGQPVYTHQAAVYPPASFALLWPLLGWLPLDAARRLWAITSLAALAWLAALFVRESAVQSRLARACVALLPLSVYATRAVIVNGQVILHELAVLITGLIVLHRGQPGWRRDLGGGALILLGLVKPTVAGPFLWLLITAKGWVRPTVLVGLGYLGLTIVAMAFQPSGSIVLVRQWLAGAVKDAVRASPGAHANLHSWLGALRLEAYDAPLSLLVLAMLGWWIVRFSREDLWLRLGMAALVARFWSFHFRYDDVLIVLPMITLIHLTGDRAASDRSRRAARVLLALTGATLLAPARLFFLPWPWTALFEAGQTIVWLALLGFLAVPAWRGARPVTSAPAPRGETSGAGA
jgi:hypothetical protein